MLIPDNIIANADDLGYDTSVNKGILYCFEQGYINSTSLMTNLAFFEETVDLIHQNPSIHNIGLHINLGEGKPLTNFKQAEYLDKEGNFDIYKINKPLNILSPADKAAFLKEIQAQIDKAVAAKVTIVHIDSHCHLHTLPCFYKLFLAAAKQYNLKIRLAQTYNEGNYAKFYFRKYINNLFKKSSSNYADYFETVEHFLQSQTIPKAAGETTEIMLHPYFDPSGVLKDHHDEKTLQDWLKFLDKGKVL